MFTGIVESTGIVASFANNNGGARLCLEKVPFAGALAVGESVAVNGCCLTVTETTRDGQVFFDLLGETLRVTSLGDLEPGACVNLERALAVGNRMSGHYVQGHIDCVSEILATTPVGNDLRLEIRLPEKFRHLVVQRGSIAVDGVSLTVAELGGGAFTLWIIPHTAQVTNLGAARAGGRVNLEFDILAKYVDRMDQVRRENR